MWNVLRHLVGFLVLASSCAFGQQFQEWHFQLPSGWQWSQEGQLALLTPSNSIAGATYIKLFPGEMLSGQLPEWLESRVAQDTRGLTILQSNPMLSVQTNAGYPTFQKLMAVQTANGERAIRMYVASSPLANRAELLMFHGEMAHAQQYSTVFGNFIKTIQFSDPQHSRHILPAGNTEVAVGNPHPGPLNGWYAGYHLQVFTGPHFTSFSKTVWNYYGFFPNGWVYTSFPEQLDLSLVSCPQAGIGEGKCQPYSVQGNTITIGQHKPEAFLTNKDGFSIGRSKVWPLRPLRAMPVGTYEAVGGGGTFRTSALSVDDITFFSNGTFTHSGSTGIISPGAAGSTTAYGSRGGSGHFKVTGYQLELDYDNGKVVREKILAPSADPDLLVIGNSNYLKKKPNH